MVNWKHLWKLLLIGVISAFGCTGGTAETSPEEPRPPELLYADDFQAAVERVFAQSVNIIEVCHVYHLTP